MKELQIAEKFCKEVVAHFKKEVKAIWLLTVEKNKEITLTILLDDLNVDKLRRAKIESVVKQVEKKILKEDQVAVHTGFYDLSKYFENIMKGNLVMFSEIRNSQPLYDPTGFFTPLKPLIEEGEIIGTRESLLKLIHNVKGRLAKIDMLKLEVLENLYSAVVSAGQAPLIAMNCPAPIPKEVSKHLKKHFVKKGLLSMEYVDIYNEIAGTFKDFEHKRKVDISGKELDVLAKKSKAFISKMEHLVSSIHKGEES